jgi:hypothetical protein
VGTGDAGAAADCEGGTFGWGARPSPQAEASNDANAIQNDERTLRNRGTADSTKANRRLCDSLARMISAGQRARVAFAAAWIGGQAALIATAPCRSDHILGFRMFPEASTLEIHLSRVVRGGSVAAPRGEWSAVDDSGQRRHFSWHDRVRDPTIGAIDTRVFASYGVDAQIARLRRALDDVVDHLDEDSETEGLEANVVVSKNGREPYTVTLLSHPRRGG